MDVKILQNIGLTDGEIKVYLALIKLGSSTTGPITKISNVSASKTYSILERLMQKGLVSYVIKERTRYYQAEDPSKLKEYINKKEEDLQKQKEEIDKLIPQLQLQKKLGQSKNEVQIYKGFKGIQTITDHIYLKLKKGDTWYNIGVPSYQSEKYHNYWHEDHLKRIKKGIKSKMLFNINTPKEIIKNRNSYKDCEAKYMPIPVETPSWILIYKDVTVIALPSDNPIAIEIENEQISKAFMEYFNAFWKIAEKEN